MTNSPIDIITEFLATRRGILESKLNVGDKMNQYSSLTSRCMEALGSVGFTGSAASIFIKTAINSYDKAAMQQMARENAYQMRGEN